MPKKFEMTFELNGDIDPKLTRTFDDLSKDVTGLGRDFNSLQRAKGFRKITRDAEDAKGAFHELREDVKEFGEIFEKTLQFTGAHAIITRVGDMFSNMINEVGALDDSVHQMGAATGATEKDMAEFKDTIQEIYAGNYGEGFDDIADSLVNVRQVTGLAGDALEQATKNALILKDTFGYDVNETVRTTDALMRNMGLTADQAFDLIAQGSQRGLNRSDDLLDTLNEYSVHFKDAGYDAEEMFSILESGLKKGTFNLDMMGDLLKEFNIQIRSGDKAVTDALDYLFAPTGIDSFVDALSKGGTKVKEFTKLSKVAGKDVATDLVKSLKKGGASAEKASSQIVSYMSDSHKIIQGLGDGSLKARDALGQIITKLDSLDDANTKNQMGVALFGTKYEDLKHEAVEALKDINGEYDKTIDTMQQISEVKYTSVKKELQGLGRELMTNLVIPIGEDVMPALNGVTEWATDNKDLVKTLALGVPAAMLAKNAYSMGKDFTKVGKSFFDTTNGASKFDKTLSMMTSPAGIAVGAIGLVTTAVLTYKKHQEEAREELLNMGDSLQKSFDDYHAIDDQTRRTQNLITEYKKLTDKINDSKTPAQDLAEARRKLADTEKELIKLNPDILSAEDAKNGVFMDQLDTLNKIDNTTREISRRDLEAKVFDAQDNLPNLVAEYEDMTSKVDDYKQSMLDAEKSYQQFKSYAARARQIYDTTQPGSEEQRQKEDELANEILKATGQDYIGRVGQVKKTMDDYKALYDSMRTKLNETDNSIIEAEKSYQQLYDKQVELIQINDLGGEKFSTQAAKFAKMTDEEKKRFEEAASHIRDLNAAMDEMPLSKKIDLSVVWHQTGTIPDYSTPAGKQIKHIELRDPGFNGYADGGRVTSPELAWIGEGGDDEFVIPVNNSKRSRGLYAAAGEALGIETGGTWAPVFNMPITIHGNADAKVVAGAVRDGQKEWESHLRTYERTQRRRSLSSK